MGCSKPLAYVLDGDALQRRFLECALPGFGYECRAFESFADLAAACLLRPPQLVLCAVGAGPVDGVAACLALRRAQPRVRIVMMSGDPVEGERVRGAGLGHALLKPYSLAELRGALAGAY